MMSNDLSISPGQTPDEADLARLVVDTLGLETVPEAIAPEAPLYGEGLGLDSIDILEIALVVSKKFGFQMRADDADNQKIFSSLRTLSQHIQLCRTK
jgi:acyl carrier protein